MTSNSQNMVANESYCKMLTSRKTNGRQQKFSKVLNIDCFEWYTSIIDKDWKWHCSLCRAYHMHEAMISLRRWSTTFNILHVCTFLEGKWIIFNHFLFKTWKFSWKDTTSSQWWCHAKTNEHLVCLLGYEYFKQYQLNILMYKLSEMHVISRTSELVLLTASNLEQCFFTLLTSWFTLLTIHLILSLTTETEIPTREQMKF